VIEVVVGIAGMGGLGGVYLNNKKINSEIRRAQAEIGRAKQETELKIEMAKAENELKIVQAQAVVVNDLQEERNEARSQVIALHIENEKLRELADLCHQRTLMLEMILHDNHIPLPY